MKAQPLLILCAAFGLFVAFAPASAEDAKTDELMAEAAQALEAKEYARAVTLAKAAMKDRSDESRYRMAVLLRAEGHLGCEQPKHCLALLRQLLTLCERDVPLSDPDRAVYERAREVVQSESPNDYALHKQMARQSRKLVRLSKRWLKKDPQAAHRAAVAALALDPLDETAGRAVAAAEEIVGAGPQELIDTKTMKGWKSLTDKQWPRQDGVLVGHVPDTAMIITTEKTWSGNYEVVMEARLIEAYGGTGPPLFSVIAPFVSDTRYVSSGYMTGNLEAYEWTAKGQGKTHGRSMYDDLPGNPPPTDWLRYRVRVLEDEIVMLVEDVEIARLSRPDVMDEAHLGIKVQFCKIEVRSFVVTGL